MEKVFGDVFPGRLLMLQEVVRLPVPMLVALSAVKNQGPEVERRKW